MKERPFPVIFQSGFRLFFLGAAGHAVVSMLFWQLFYVGGKNIFVGMPLTVWHGHEMIFGFTMAVVAGFLLTAVANWTGIKTISEWPLLGLFTLWLAGRILAFLPARFPFWPLAVCDFLFLLFLTVAVLKPIVATKQWNQSAVFSKLIMLLLAGLIFYGGLMAANLEIQRKVLRFSVYVLISLILTVGRRIMPFFIERGVGYPVALRNSRKVDILSVILLVIFTFLDVFYPARLPIVFLSLAIGVLHFYRLAGWYTPGIMKKPLLWILFFGYLFIIVGFFLKATAMLMNRPDDSALHAFTAGGIGIFTLGMMSRVAWGHTGRNIGDPPRYISAMFGLILGAALVRTFFPLIWEVQYIAWIAISQVLWMLAFSQFLMIYGPVLLQPRVDGKYG